MNSPYNGNFKVTQQYKTSHTGLDLVGIDSKEIHSTVNGIVEVASNADPNGFGIYVRIKQDGTGHIYYYGHMSSVKVKVGQRVAIGNVIGIEGSTGKSTGSHCHYESRTKAGTAYAGTLNISNISGIPNALGIYNDGYKPTNTTFTVRVDKAKAMVRSQPNSTSALAGSKELVKGNTFVSVGTVQGENVSGNNIWYKSEKGNYVWSGGLTRI